jgi:hypothetical protein
MADPAKTNWLTDIALPIFAFVSAASGPYGAAAANSLTAALNAGERRRSGRRQEAQYAEALDIERQSQAQKRALDEREYALELPGRQAKAQRAQFEAGNLQDIASLLYAPAPAQQAVQALGAPQVGRLQEALGRGEQVPLPMSEPSAQLVQQRYQRMATSPGGAAQLTAAGMGDVAQRAREAAPKPVDPREFAKDKREAMGIFDNVPPGSIDAGVAAGLKRQIAQAKDQDQLNEALIQIPVGLGAKPGSPEEQTFRELAPKLGGLGAMRAMAEARREPPTALDLQEQQARISKLQSDIEKNKMEGTGQLSTADRKKFQAQTIKDIQNVQGVKDYNGALVGYRNIANGFSRQDGVGDNAMLVGFVRLTDPNSVARPSEVEMARQAQSLHEQAKAMLARWVEGEQLSPEVRERFYSFAKNLMLDYGSTVRREVVDSPVYSSLLRDTGLTIDDVIVPPLTEREMASQQQERMGRLQAERPGATPQAPAAQVPDPAQLSPADLSNLTPEQLDALERRLQGGK